MRARLSFFSLLSLGAMLAFPASAQQHKYQTSIPPGVATITLRS